MEETITPDRLPEAYKDCFLFKPKFPKGRIEYFDNGAFSQQLAEAVAQSIQVGKSWKVVVDMSGIKYLSSSGIRVLLTARQQVMQNERGGKVILADCQPQVKEALGLPGFSEFFTQINLIAETPTKNKEG